MRYIGAHIGHDASVVVLNEDGEIIFYSQVERVSRFKNHGFELDPIGQAFPELEHVGEEDLLCICAMDRPGEPKWRACLNVAEPILEYNPFLIRPYTPANPENFLEETFGKDPDLFVHHHLCHAAAAWAFRPDDRERLFLMYDGCGYDARLRMTSQLLGYLNADGFSIIDAEEHTHIPTSVPLTGLLGYNSAGKAMGLAGYMPQQEWTHDMTMKLVFSMLGDHYDATYPFFKNSELTDENRQFIANFYRFYTGHIWSALKSNIRRFGNKNGVVIGGGTALALEVNSKIYDLAGEVIFAPPTDDSGLALGAAAIAYWHAKKKWVKVSTPSLNDLQDPLPRIGPQSPQEIAKWLAEDRVIGLLRGKSEAGPRALGFRSILASAKEDHLKRVSQDLKDREYYRPLAPVVTAEQFDELFKGPKGEYMQYLAHCTGEAKKRCPAICHVDGTARPQVVYQEKDPWLHELLVEYGKLSGVECLINTSLNRKSKPICHTYEDVRREMRGRDIDIVSISYPAWTPHPKHAWI